MNELRRWGWSHSFELAYAELPADPGCLPARVISQHRGAYGLITEAGEATGVAPGRMLFRATGRRALPAVGDWVRVRPAADGPAVIEEILPRLTEFVRRRAGTESGEQVIAANIDVAFLVSSLNLELSPRRLERYLVATRDSGAEPVVLLSKADLVDDFEAALEAVRQVSGDAPVVTFSAFTGEGLEQLEPWLQPGRTVVLLGSSGVGKSTLVNRLSGRELRTQDIRAADDRGRHTTTHREIFLLPSGALMLDTPGMRELGLVDAEEGLQESFDDIDALVGECRFRDCRHESEPGCAVRAAHESGELSSERWESYLKLDKELRYQQRRTDPVAERAEQARWKAIHKQFRKMPKKGRSGLMTHEPVGSEGGSVAQGEPVGSASGPVAKGEPVGSGERIAALDVLRGFAILGILVINIQSFSMVSAAYLNPAANEKLAGAGYWVWAVSYLLGDLKFMGIFSMLFGAGIVLMAGRAESRGAGATGIHYRRTFWLLIIGLLHAHLIWHGDILVTYALCALTLYWFRRLPPRWLLAAGVVSLLVATAIFLMAGTSMQFWPPEEVALQSADWAPPQEVRDVEIAQYRGGWLQQMEHRVPEALAIQTFVFLMYLGWRAGGMMLIGMALFKWGVLSASRSRAFYVRLAVAGLGIGLPIVAWGIVQNTRAAFSFQYSMFLGSLFNYWGSIGVSLGYIALMMLAVKGSVWPALQRRLAATGRMALTNYIAQSLICTFIFYGHGLGLFERVTRPWQLLIVIAVFGLQLLWSPWWLQRYRFGPLEWAWRSLTYWQRQPMRA